MEKKASNKNLHKASQAKKDEFYTQLVDIEKELKHYKDQFRGKVVYCNCDDPYESNFFKFFASKFNDFKLRKLITTSYSGSPIIGGQLPLPQIAGSKGKQPIKIEINKVPANKDGSVGLVDVERLLKHDTNVATPLRGGGDFRSDECIQLLKEADIVVTNPPFSLFRQYLAQLVEYNKKFLIIGNVNAITYKECFRLIKDNKMWLGVSIHSGDREFRVPDNYPLEAAGSRVDGEGNKFIRVKGVRWFTNFDYKERHEKITFYKNYDPKEYPKYDNYDAIEISKTLDIPQDYKGVMGVPITFLDKYNPEQFEILGMCENLDLYKLKIRIYTSEECKKRYLELFGKKGTYDLNASAVINGNKVYQRLLIKSKKAKK